MSWDPRSERITARAQAEVAKAKAEQVRAETQQQQRREQAELDHQEAERKRVRKIERRQALADAVRRHGGLALPAVAVGSPAVIAWNGQYQFAKKTMDLGVLAPLLPIAIEGSVLYAAFMAHKAVADNLPAGRYRALTWTLAGVAAAMNCWHGKTLEIGVMLGLTSLLSIVLLELTIALRKAKENKVREGRDAAAIRRALIRRIRYPRLSASAAALAAARGLSAEEAWRAAWVERYGLGPDAPRHERKVARQVLKRETSAAKQAAKNGSITIVDGQLIPASLIDSGDDSGERPDTPVQGERLEPTGTTHDTIVALEAPEGIAAIERWLSDRANTGGALLELPPAPDRERRDERVSDRPNERDGEREDERPRERVVSAPGERPDERSGERASKRPRKRGRTKGRKRARVSGAHAERLQTVRDLLAKHPDLSGAQIEAETGIPESTARRLAAQIRNEGTDGGER
ncbi:DUF2637 domain-containing protein [Actinomadura sp. WAC 06369]|uniref:DUF2637 domain-containing protein n=1 Tax=Actinomadura sp. WAC 06369 TaxID=2203193 RepID=UPI000F79F852|nr:DUF2637 domain-containing protein [Actinomadura sp. WAC 06369]RSN53319.1 hypothetical protein DMH08_27700 [Actinomadura sp. WAC 06369]